MSTRVCTHIALCVCTCTFARPWFTVSDVARASPFKPPVPLPVPVSPVRKAAHNVLPAPASQKYWVPRAPLPLSQQGKIEEGGCRLCAWCTVPAVPGTRGTPGHRLRQLRQIFRRKGLHFFPQLTSVFVTAANGADNCRGLAHTLSLIPSSLVIRLANCPPWAPNLSCVSRGWWGRQAAWPEGWDSARCPSPVPASFGAVRAACSRAHAGPLWGEGAERRCGSFPGEGAGCDFTARNYLNFSHYNVLFC